MTLLIIASVSIHLIYVSSGTADHNGTWSEYLEGLAWETESYFYKFAIYLEGEDTFYFMHSDATLDSSKKRNDASRVARSLQAAFSEDPKAENLTTVRLKMLDSTMQFFGLMSHVADQLYKPFGPAKCRLLADADYDRTKLSAVAGTGCKDGVNSTLDSCLLLAVTEHTNYSDQAVRSLKKALEKYAYIAVNVKSFCFEFIENNARNNIGKLVKENLDYISDLSIGAQATDRLPLRPGLWLCPSINFRIDSFVECPRIDVNSAANGQYKPIENKLTEHGWQDRQELHKRIIDNTVRNLSAKYKKYTFYALAFLPYNQESQQCAESIPNRYVDGRLIDASQANLNFFVRYVAKVDDTDELRSKLNSTWQAINSKRSSILNALFDDPNEKLCKRLARVLNGTAGVNFEETDSGVGAFAAIKCGYHFVWYELAYAYFPAAATDSPYTFEVEGNNKYDANCGQLILFP